MTPVDDPKDQPGAVEKRPRKPRSGWAILWREWLRPLLLIAVVMFSFRSAVADWNDVPTGSMKPTILEGDRIFINKIAYDLKFPFTTWRLAEWDDPNWGDIVVLRSPEDGKRLVKRVVGLPGDIIEIRGSRLYVNGEPASYLRLEQEVVDQIDRELQPAFLFANEVVAGRRHPVMITLGSPGTSSSSGPFQVPESQFFVMGDNRSNSRDSRWFGPVDRTAILGRATAVALSVDPERHYMPRWSRFFSRLP
ncbi:MAG: signal peptidase I [bacterium]|nr:signal peptidase I [bacterium]